MAEGWAKSMRVFSQVDLAGIETHGLNPKAVTVMAEMGIDIAVHMPEPFSTYLDTDFDIVATVCDNAREACPVFTGSCKQKIHHGFVDPADATGSDTEITEVYRQIRDEIQVWLIELLEV